MNITATSRKVMMAKPWRPCALGSLDRTSYMILDQFQFPLYYEPGDKLTTFDSDRIDLWHGLDHFHRVCREFTGTGDQGMPHWFEQMQDPKRAIEFICALNKIEEIPPGGWTGFRAMGSVNVSNGYSLCTLELFWKNPATPEHQLFSGKFGDNVEKPDYGNMISGHGYADECTMWGRPSLDDLED